MTSESRPPSLNKDIVLRSDDSSEDETFLEKYGTTCRRGQKTELRGSLGYWQRLPWQRKAVVHLLLMGMYTIVFLIATSKLSPAAPSSSMRLPLVAQDAIKKEIRRFPTKTHDNPFAGDPRPELDGAWHELMQNDIIQVPLEDLDRFNLSSLELADGSGEIVSLSVYHALHCLKKIRRWIHKDYYYPNRDEDVEVSEGGHANHCIEYIRESLMCKPDLSPVTYSWVHSNSNDRSLAATNKDWSLHECINWEVLDSWAAERRFDLFRLDLLRYPGRGL